MSSIRNDNNRKVELVFPRQGTKYDMYLPKVKPSDFFGMFTTNIAKVGEWCRQYKIDSMEIWIIGIIDTEETTRLLVGTKEEDKGLKVILKPKSEMNEDEKK